MKGIVSEWGENDSLGPLTKFEFTQFPFFFLKSKTKMYYKDWIDYKISRFDQLYIYE